MRFWWPSIRISTATLLLGMTGCVVAAGEQRVPEGTAIQRPPAKPLAQPLRPAAAGQAASAAGVERPIRLVGAAEPTGVAELPAASQFGVPQAASTGEPAAGQPIAGEPAAGQPIAGEPAAGQPAAGEPIAVPDTSQAVLTLYDVIGLAIRTSPDVRSARSQLQIARATLDRARAEFYPKLGISEAYGISNGPVQAFSFQLNQARFNFSQDFNHPKAIDDFHTQVRVAHRLYAGGRRAAEADAAAEAVSAAGYSLAAVQNQLVYHAAEAYYRLLQAEELVRVRREAVEQVRQHLQIVRARYRAQTAVKSDVLSVEVRLAEVREALISARNQMELAWAVLENVLGTPVARRPLPDAVPAAPWSDHVDDVQQSVAEALARRPEMGQLASSRAAAANRVAAARAGKRLAIDFVTDYDVYTGDFVRGNDAFFTGLVAQLNLFDGGRTASEVRQAIGRVRQLDAQQRRMALDIELDVRRATLQLDDAQQRLAVASQVIRQARESLREIEVRYRRQAVTVVELIDAQVALSNARVRQANARAEVEVARAAVERAIGRLTDFVAAL